MAATTDGEIDLATVDVDAIGKSVFITDVERETAETKAMLSSTLEEVQAEVAAAEQLQAQIAEYVAAQEEQRNSLETYITELFAKADDDDGSLVTLPDNYEDVLAAMEDAARSRTAAAARDGAREGDDDDGAREGDDDGVSVLSLESDWSHLMDWGDGGAAASVLAERDERAAEEDRVSKGMAMMQKLDAKLLRLHKQAKELQRARKAEERGSEGDAGSDEASDAGSDEASDTGGRQRGGRTAPRAPRVARGQNEAFFRASEEDTAIVEALMAADSDEEAETWVAHYPSSEEVARLRDINEALKTYLPETEWADKGLDVVFGDADSAKTAAFVESDAAATTATGKRDYLREQRINREQRRKLFAVEGALRKLATNEDVAAQPELVRALLIDALIEQDQVGDVDPERFDTLDVDAVDLGSIAEDYTPLRSRVDNILPLPGASSRPCTSASGATAAAAAAGAAADAADADYADEGGRRLPAHFPQAVPLPPIGPVE